MGCSSSSSSDINPSKGPIDSNNTNNEKNMINQTSNLNNNLNSDNHNSNISRLKDNNNNNDKKFNQPMNRK